MKSLLIAMLMASATAHAADQPYAGQHERPIKALSQEEVNGYLRGAGMGLAKAAELNGYPGPMHALELATPLELSETQRARLQQLLDAHKAEARALGAEVVTRERALDQLFATRTVTPAAVDEALAALADAQARLRAAHLKTHLSTAELLTAAQIGRYAELRGYGAAPAHTVGHGH